MAATLGLAMAQPTPIDRDRLRLVLPMGAVRMQGYSRLAETLDRQRLQTVFHMLSPRQKQVAAMLLDGCSLRQMADLLGLSDSTVCTYVRRMKQLL